MVEEFTSFIPYIVFLGGIVTVATIAYNNGKTITTLKKDIDQLRTNHISEKSIGETRDIENKKDIELQIEKLKTEIDQKIVKTVANQKDEFVTIQKQIDSTKSDVKTLLAKIEVTETKVNASEEVHQELKQIDKENHKFHSDWNQRIEDSNEETVKMIERTREQLISMILALVRKDKNGNA